MLTGMVSLSLLSALQNQKTIKKCTNFAIPVGSQWTPWWKPKLPLPALPVSNQQCSREKVAKDKLAASPGFLPIQDFSLSSPHCFHCCLIALDRSSLYLSGLPIFLFFFFFFETEFRSCYPGWSAMAQSRLTETSAPWVQAILLPQPPE